MLKISPAPARLVCVVSLFYRRILAAFSLLNYGVPFCLHYGTPPYRRMSSGVKAKKTGFSLIELLISILIFAIGFLGIASLQTQAMRMAHDAQILGQATILANSLADTLRVHEDANDISSWQSQVENSLPNGVGSLSQSGSIHIIQLEWIESADGSKGLRNYTVEVSL